MLEDEVVSLESALRDARRRLANIDVELRGGHIEDSLVDKTLSYLVKYFPEKIVEAAAACSLSPDVAPCYTFVGPPLTFARPSVTCAAASPPTPQTKIKLQPVIPFVIPDDSAPWRFPCKWTSGSGVEILHEHWLRSCSDRK